MPNEEHLYFYEELLCFYEKFLWEASIFLWGASMFLWGASKFLLLCGASMRSFYVSMRSFYVLPQNWWNLDKKANISSKILKPEDHWSCIAHLIAEGMLKSAVIEEKTFKHSPWEGTDNPLGPKFWCQQVGLITMVICCKFTKGTNLDVNRKALSLYPFVASFKEISLKSDFIHFFHHLIHVYSPRAGGI